MFKFIFHKKIKSLLIIFCFINAGIVFAQNTGLVRGFVYLKESGEPVLFTNVVLKGTLLGIATDVNGFFSINKVPAGNYTLFVSSTLGYDTIAQDFTIKAGEIFNTKLFFQLYDQL